MPQVEVAFDIDANGILHVSAKDKATNKEQKIRIEASSGLSDTEIDRMVKAAEQHASEDKERREQIEQRNQLDSLIYRVEKDSKEWVDRLPADAKSRLDAALEGAKQALRSGEAGRHPQGAGRAQRAPTRRPAPRFTRARRARAARPGGRGRPGRAGGRPGGPEDVVEADYEIVDDKK